MSRHGEGGGEGGDSGGDETPPPAPGLSEDQLMVSYQDAKHVAANQTATFDPPIDALFVKANATGAVTMTIGDGTYAYPAANLTARTIVSNIGPISGITEAGTGTMSYIALREYKHVTSDTIG